MFKEKFRELLPPFCRRFITGLFYGWHGNYRTWSEAKAKCKGYDSQDILNRVIASALKVKEGSAVYERDSFIFKEVQYSYPLLSALLWIAATNSGKLNVLDFGGSLGSTYFQNRKFLDDFSSLNWCVVEQPHFVKSGNEFFKDNRLHFFNTIEECIQAFKIDVVLLSSVLQYIEEPFLLLDKIKSLGFKYIIIDRTPFVNGKDRITIQKVNPKIYDGSYPCWFFNKEKFISGLSSEYEKILEFEALDKANISSEFKGFIFKRRDL